MELVKIDHNEYGIEESKAKQISAVFKPMLDKMEELEAEYNEISKLDIDNPETAHKAKELRLKYVKVRTGTAAIHKEQKSFYLAGGRFVDGWKNAQLFASEGIESKLMEIEKHEEKKEQELLAKLKESRVHELLKYGRENDPINVELFDDEGWSSYLAGVKLQFDQAKEAEAKAEKERLENERLDKLEETRRFELAPYAQFITSNNDLRNMSDEDYNKFFDSLKVAKSEYEAEQEKIRLENESLKKAEAERIEKEKKEKAEREAEEAKLKAEQEAKLNVEREAREKAESELKAKQEAEAKAKADEEAKVQAELNAGDAEKVNMLKAYLKEGKDRYSFKSAKNKKMYAEVGALIDKVIAHIGK